MPAICCGRWEGLLCSVPAVSLVPLHLNQPHCQATAQKHRSLRPCGTAVRPPAASICSFSPLPPVMSAEEPPAGPEGGRASPAGPSRPSEAAPEAHNPLFDDPEAAEGGEAPSSAVQETGPSGGSRAGGGGGDEQAGDDHSSAHSSAGPDSGAATAAEQLAALQLGSSTAEGGSSGAGHAGEAAAAIGGSPAGSDAELEEKASDEEEEDEEEDEPEESGTIKAHGGPASAPRLGASACGAGKVRSAVRHCACGRLLCSLLCSGNHALREPCCPRCFLHPVVARGLVQPLTNKFRCCPPPALPLRHACRHRPPPPLQPPAAPASASPSQRRPSAWPAW